MSSTSNFQTTVLRLGKNKIRKQIEKASKRRHRHLEREKHALVGSSLLTCLLSFGQYGVGGYGVGGYGVGGSSTAVPGVYLI